MNQTRDKALKLRIEGHSYNEINKKLGVPKATLSNWFSDLSLSSAARRRISTRVGSGFSALLRRNKEQTRIAQKLAKQNQLAGAERIGRLSSRELLLIGATLYWAEGHKKLRVIGGFERTGHAVAFTNSDPEMVKLFLRFLFGILEIPREKVRLGLRLFEHQQEKEVINYWCKVTGLLPVNFIRSSYVISKSSQGKRPYNRLPYGTLQVTVSDTNKFHHILGLIEGLKTSC